MKQRKIAYISETVLTDCDLPLLHELSKEVVVDYYIVVTNNSRQGTLIDLTLKEKGGIYRATEYPELKVLEKWIQLTFIKNFHRFCCIRFTPDFILLNKTQKAPFIKAYGISESRVHLSRLSIYTHLKESASAPRFCSNPYILFIGSIHSHKGIEYLCEAMEPIINDLPDMHVIIAGKGQFYFDISRYEKNPNYMFINRYISNEELVSLISNSIAVVCPYIDATQSGVIMSAFALNKPVIATNVGALPETVEDGRYGLLVPLKDSKALERAIRQIIQPGIAQQMSENIAHDYSAGVHSWSSIASGMLDIYDTIINRRKTHDKTH